MSILAVIKRIIMSRLFLTLLGVLLTSIISAQFCGTPQETLLARVDVNKKSISIHQRNVQKFIPVTFHLVASISGSGRVKEEEVLKQVASLNVQYGDQEAVFYIDHFNSFNNDAVYNTPASSAAKTQMRLRRDNNSINVFITNTAENGGGSPGVVLAYYDPQEDWIVSRKDRINGGASTLAHELGHFFSLPHPFSGWDCHPYTTDEYTNPVNVDFTIPCDEGGGSALIELQNGSNCNNAGDHICDTPPDYNLGLLYQNDCDTNKTIMDKNGQVITPMVNNYMSYYNNCDDYAFTPNQKTLINTDFFSAQRFYIRTSVIPNTTPVTGPVVYISPINGELTPGPTNILFDWEDTPGANRYMVIIDRFASFTFNPQKYFVTESTLTLIDGLTEDKPYYWKVWPYNESQTGAMYSPTQNFIVGTGVGVNEIKEINEYALSPNPAHFYDRPVLTLSSIKTFEAQLEVTDISGHIVWIQDLSIPSGTSKHIIPTEEFTAGIYFITVHFKGGILVERLLIME